MHNTAFTIFITAVITALLCAAIFAVYNQQHPNEEDALIERRRSKIVTPTFVLLIISIIMNGIGLLGLSAVATDTNRGVSGIENESGQVIQHRVRNEAAHGCIEEYLQGIVKGVNQLIQRKTDHLTVENTCPKTLTEQEIRNLKHGGGSGE
jgi:hypothetical protein